MGSIFQAGGKDGETCLKTGIMHVQERGKQVRDKTRREYTFAEKQHRNNREKGWIGYRGKYVRYCTRWQGLEWDLEKKYIFGTGKFYVKRDLDFFFLGIGVVISLL